MSSSKPTELKIMENKPLVLHVLAEALVIIGIVFYFSSKNKKLLSHIEELSQTVEEQEDRIQKLENSLEKTNNLVLRMNSIFEKLNIMKMKPEISKEQVHVKKQEQSKKKEPKIINIIQEEKKKVKFDKQEQVQEFSDDEDLDDDELSNSDLDDEIQTELEELKNQ